jgi:hypothetical protein
MYFAPKADAASASLDFSVRSSLLRAFIQVRSLESSDQSGVLLANGILTLQIAKALLDSSKPQRRKARVLTNWAC